MSHLWPSEVFQIRANKMSQAVSHLTAALKCLDDEPASDDMQYEIEICKLTLEQHNKALNDEAEIARQKEAAAAEIAMLQESMFGLCSMCLMATTNLTGREDFVRPNYSAQGRCNRCNRHSNHLALFKKERV